MKKLLSTALVPVLLVGCQSTDDSNSYATRQAWVGEVIHGASMRRAIISQRTIFPYHFHSGATALNELGQRDVKVLAKHFAEIEGEINLHRGDASFDLYAGRTRVLAAALEDEGVDSFRVTIVDGSPGGSGISGARVLKVLEAQQESSKFTSIVTTEGK